MIHYHTGETMRATDARASEEMKIDGALLMENAGRGAVDAILARYPAAKGFLILCGPGSNGGDGFVAARHIATRGHEATVIATADDDRYSGAAAAAFRACCGCGITIRSSSELSDDEIEELIKSSDVVVDALLGTGAAGAPRGEISRVLTILRRARELRDLREKRCGDHLETREFSVVSLDIPSGVDADTGASHDEAVHAEMTITFFAPKVGLAITPGAHCAGEIVVADIGAPETALNGMPAATGFDRTDVPRLLPRVSSRAHKGSRGGVLIVGGSEQYRGAPLLAARAALRTGCGYVFLAVPKFMANAAAAYVPEAVLLPIDTDESGCMKTSSLDDALPPLFHKVRSAIIGPGLGRSDSAERIVRRAVDFHKDVMKPLLLDADALFHLAMFDFTGWREGLVITPHTAEAARLLGTTPADVDANRLASCRQLAQRYGTVLLKGPHTLISSEDGATRVVLEGGPELAVSGSGDVLSGIIGALLARGARETDASTLGALLHALAGDSFGVRDGIMASDIADAIPAVMAV